MQLPRLTDVGDTFAAEVASCMPEGSMVTFTFVGYPGATLAFSRINVDAKLMEMGFYDKPTRDTPPDGVILYADVAGEWLRFTRTAGTRGGVGWRIVKANPEPKAPTPAPEPPKAPAARPESAAPAPRAPAPSRAESESPEGKRENIRAAYSRELTYVLAGPAKIAKKAKADFDVNAAVSVMLIEMAKRGCL